MNNGLKILFVQQDTCTYGASQSLLTLIDQLKLRRHDCMVLLPHVGDLSNELEKRGVPIVYCRWRGWTCNENDNSIRSLLGGIRDFIINRKRISQIIGLVQNFQPNLIHTNSSKTYFGAILSRKLKIPHVWHFREFIGGPFSVGLRFRFGRRLSEWVISHYANATIFISREVAKEYRDVKINKNIIYNGVFRKEQIQVILKPHRINSTLELCLVGRFDAWKDPMTALKAFSILKSKGYGQKVKLNIAGWGGDQLDEVQKYVTEHSLERSVTFLGIIKNMEAFYKSCHVLLMPSKGDAFGRATAEAMAHGLPVIGAKAGATPELIDDGINGLLFKPENYSELAEQILYLMNNPEKIGRMGENAHKKALTLFTAERYANEILKVYHRVLSS